MKRFLLTFLFALILIAGYAGLGFGIIEYYSFIVKLETYLYGNLFWNFWVVLLILSLLALAGVIFIYWLTINFYRLKINKYTCEVYGIFEIALGIYSIFHVILNLNTKGPLLIMASIYILVRGLENISKSERYETEKHLLFFDIKVERKLELLISEFNKPKDKQSKLRNHRIYRKVRSSKRYINRTAPRRQRLSTIK